MIGNSLWGVRTLTRPVEACSMNAVTEMSAISLPRPMTMRCSAVRAISLIRWEETKTVRPSPRATIRQIPQPTRTGPATPSPGRTIQHIPHLHPEPASPAELVPDLGVPAVGAGRSQPDLHSPCPHMNKRLFSADTDQSVWPFARPNTSVGGPC
jgi:hypothetical protein